MAEKEEELTVEKVLEKGEKIGEYKLVISRKGKILEDLYFKIVSELTDDGWEVVKRFERLTLTPGATAWTVFGGRVQAAQDRVMAIGRTVADMVRTSWSIFNDIQRYEQLAMLLNQYFNAKDEKTKNAALLRLKHFWATKIDPHESGISIDTLANIGYASLRDAFYLCKSLDEVDKLDLAEKVKNLLKMKLRSFFNWLEFAKEDVPRRLEFLKSYLKQYVAYIKTYIDWLKPYLQTVKALKVHKAEIPYLFSYLDQEYIVSSLVILKDFKTPTGKSYSIAVLFNFEELGRITTAGVPPRGERIVHYGILSIKMQAYIIDPGSKGKIKEAVKKEDEKIIEEVLGRETQNMVKKMEEYLKKVEDLTKRYYEGLLKIKGVIKEEKKKEEKKKKLADKLKEETAIIGAIIEIFERIKKKEKKEEKKEKKKEEKKEFKIDKEIKKDATSRFEGFKHFMKKVLNQIFLPPLIEVYKR